MKDWEGCYQTGETPWDHGGVAPPLLELMGEKGVELWGDGPVLVPGCGFGHDVRALAEAGIPAIGLDISETAVTMARRFPGGFAASYQLGDFLDPEWRAGRSFPAIWEHTCFCAILPEQRQAYAESAAALLPPGGHLCGVFYLRPHDPGESAEGPPFGVTSEALDALFSPWFELVEGWVPQLAYPGREGREWIGIFRRLPQARVAGETGCR